MQVSVRLCSTPSAIWSCADVRPRHTSGWLGGFWAILDALAGHVEETVVAVLHLVQHLLRLRQLLLRGLMHAAQHVYLLHQEIALPLQGIAFLA